MNDVVQNFAREIEPEQALEQIDQPEQSEPENTVGRFKVKKIKKKIDKVVDIEEGAPWNEVEELFLRRRSIRQFKKKQVPEHIIKRILEVGRFAPSQGNCQPWKFVVVRDAQMIAEMEAFCVEQCKMVSGPTDYMAHEKGTFARWIRKTFVEIFAKFRPNNMHPIPLSVTKLIAAGRFRVFHEAPTVIFPMMDTRGIGHPEIDLGCVGTNLVMAAHSHGLGTCWVGLASFMNKHKEWRERLGIDDHHEILEAISVGYPKGLSMQNYPSRELHEIVWIEDGKKDIIF
jgi:nitroreductase